MGGEVTIIAGDYSAQREDSYLSRLDVISSQRGDGGLLHGGHIHFIQQKLSDEDGFPFLKAAIAGVLDRIPSQIPYELPEMVEVEDFTPSDKLLTVIYELNDKLLFPIQGYDVVRVILAAREYEALGEEGGT